jgi:hypothetical protein
MRNSNRIVKNGITTKMESLPGQGVEHRASSAIAGIKIKPKLLPAVAV